MWHLCATVVCLLLLLLLMNRCSAYCGLTMTGALWRSSSQVMESSTRLRMILLSVAPSPLFTITLDVDKKTHHIILHQWALINPLLTGYLRERFRELPWNDTICVRLWVVCIYGIVNDS